MEVTINGISINLVKLEFETNADYQLRRGYIVKRIQDDPDMDLVNIIRDSRIYANMSKGCVYD